MLDIMPVDESDPFENYTAIRQELAAYSAELAAKPELVAVNKMDLDPQHKRLKKLYKQLGQKKVFLISAATGEGIDELMEAMWQAVQKIKTRESKQSQDEQS